MAKLENPKHEEYALLLAQGLKQRKAYVRAGYVDNAQSASKLAQAPRIKKRVEQLKKEIAQKVEQALDTVSVENWESLAEMGLTMEWVASKYKLVFEQATNAGAYAPANTALQNIQKLIELENNAKGAEDKNKSQLIPVETVTSMLSDMKEVFKAQADAEAAKPVPELIDDMKDITPND